MKGRTEAAIRESMEKMHAIAEIIFNQKLEVIPTYISDNPPEDVNQRIWYLGESIKRMSEADYFIGIEYSVAFRGCNIEADVAKAYGIRMYLVNWRAFMPDAYQFECDFIDGGMTDEE